MAAVYNLIKDYGTPDSLVSTSPIWVIAVIRWAHPFLFDRGEQQSDDTIPALDQVQTPLIIVSDCTSLEITSSKNAHVTNLTATLRDSDTNYLSSIYPDDWLMAWVLPNETKAQDVIQRIQRGEAVNQFSDGLKFLGRAQNIFKNTTVDDMGHPNSIYSLTGVGFGEFDYSLFWEPQGAVSDALPVWYQRVGLFLNDVVTGTNTTPTDDKNPGAIDIMKILPVLTRLIFGPGPFPDFNLPLPGAPGGNASPNSGISVPDLVGKLLNLETGGIDYSNLLDIIVGVQKFAGVNGAQDTFKIFTPDGLQTSTIPVQNEKSTVEFQDTQIPLLGQFPLVQLPFQFTPVWQILAQFSNPTINEMYVALLPDDQGYIYPRLTIRQKPFNSGQFASASSSRGGPAVTKFLELPRWVVDPRMLKQIQVGRSNSLRFNFFHVQGTGPGTALNSTVQYVFSPPLSDLNDIQRSGLRGAVETVNCLIEDATKGPDLWRDIVTDILAGQHLTLTGSMTISGVISPIAPGDNVQFGSVVYHIEAVTHSCSITMEGKRDWKTTLQLSHGYASEETFNDNQLDTSLDAPLDIYAGVRNADPASVAIGHTVLDLY